MTRHYFPDVYQDLEDARYFIKTKVVGVSYRQEAVAGCVEGQSLELVRDERNRHDRNAIGVFAGGAHIGFVPSDINDGFALYLDSGRSIDAEIEAVVGGTPDKPTVGIVMRLYLPEDVPIEFDGE